MHMFLRTNLLIMTAIIGLSTGCNQGHPGVIRDDYTTYPVYTENDLEMIYQPSETRFRIWSPAAEEAEVRVYKTNDDTVPVHTLPMKTSDNGTWTAKFKGDLHHHYYTFRTRHQEKWLNETPGIYVKAAGVNGMKGFICDPSEANPDGWEQDPIPQWNDYNAMVLYELHIRDISMHPNSGIQKQGKYLWLTETGTTNTWGDATGLDHLKEMGITHIHLLPVFDFRTIDETRLQDNTYNWGYDPQNYNVPEGSYSTNPFDPLVRIREFKEMVMALHKAGIGVIMDVVYNHTSDTENSN